MTKRIITAVSLAVILFLSANSNSAQEKKGKSPTDEQRYRPPFRLGP